MRNRMLEAFLAFILVLGFNLLTALPVAAEVNEVWVASSPVGDDSNSGTELEPFASIQKGIDMVLSPGIVHVFAGNYYERIILKDSVEVLGSGADVTIIDSSGEGTVVTATNVGPQTKLDGFTITGGNGSYGGGMYNESSSPIVTNCNFSGNAAGYGGGMYNESSSPTVVNSTFSGNSAISGAGIYNWTSSPTVINSTFSGNTARFTGGGMDNESYSSTLLTNCTFSGNSAFYGGGIYNSWASPTVTNSIFWGNAPTEIDSDSVINVTYSDIEEGQAGTGNIDADPLFVGGGLHLGSGSPCIDSGNNDALPADTFDIDGDGDITEKLPIDLDSNPRIFGGIVDIGAYEAQIDEPLVAEAGGPYIVNEGEGITLDASGSNDPTGGVCSYDWDLDEDGDYDDAVGVTPTISFDDDGTYIIGLKVTNNQANQDVDTASVIVNDLGPEAVLTGDDILYGGQLGAYDASGSTSSPDAIVSYEWDWDYNGVTFNPSGDTGVTQFHAWGENNSNTAGATSAGNLGTYTIAMRVTDDDGSIDIATLVITIETPSPEELIGTLKNHVSTIELPVSVENSLNASLDAAIKAIEDSDHKDVAAVNALEAFINKIEAQRGKKISTEDAAALIAQAQAIIGTFSL